MRLLIPAAMITTALVAGCKTSGCCDDACDIGCGPAPCYGQAMPAGDAMPPDAPGPMTDAGPGDLPDEGASESYDPTAPKEGVPTPDTAPPAAPPAAAPTPEAETAIEKTQFLTPIEIPAPRAS